MVENKIQFDIRKSSKSCLVAEEHFIVTHDSRVYLRILGREGSYDIVTATASEDCGRIFAFENQDLLISAAAGVIKDFFNSEFSIIYDHDNRPYVRICGCEYLSDAYRVAETLFNKLQPSVIEDS